MFVAMFIILLLIIPFVLFYLGFLNNIFFTSVNPFVILLKNVVYT